MRDDIRNHWGKNCGHCKQCGEITPIEEMNFGYCDDCFIPVAYRVFFLSCLTALLILAIRSTFQ